MLDFPVPAVPVTSTLQTPVNTTLGTAILTTNQVVSVYPESMANISVRQQVTIGSLTSLSATSDTETVIVLAVFSNYFTAFVQNEHAIGEPITATAKYGQPVTINPTEVRLSALAAGETLLRVIAVPVAAVLGARLGG